jgi:uncharacterized protein YlxW (UPF0749 family)
MRELMPDEIEKPNPQPHDSEPPSAAPTEAAPTSAGRRVLSALSGRPTRAQFVVAILLAALGLAAATQIRLTRSDEDFSGQRREDLVELLDSLSSASDRALTQIDELQQTKADLQSSSQRRQAAAAEGQNRLTVLGILSGTVAASGPGVTVTITDDRGTVTSAALLNGIEELRDAGAEAIEINDSARVIAATSFTGTAGDIQVDGEDLRPPYVIDAIGSSHTLGEAVVFPGGLADKVDELGGHTNVKEADVVRVASLHPIKQPEYSQPTDQ